MATLGRPAVRLDPRARRPAALAEARLGTALLRHSFRDFRDRGATRVGLGVDGENTTGAVRLYESVGMRQVRRSDTYEKTAVSRLRARCPDCRTFTAVAIGPGYECHSCGREFGAGHRARAAGLGRGRRGDGRGRAPAAAYPEAAVVEEETLDEQTLAVAIDLPERPLVLGGCCCAHIGAVEGLAARNGRIALVWIDAHGDLNTPESSPSGNLWGMPLRMILDSGAVDPHDAILLGARSLDPPEREYIASTACAPTSKSSKRALDGTAGVYVALDVDVLEPGEIRRSCPSPAASRSPRSSSSSPGRASGRRSWARASAGLRPSRRTSSR